MRKKKFGVQARLVEIRAGRQLEETLLTACETRIGRNPIADLDIQVDSVSRQHALIRRVDGGHEISDLGSANGTAVNGQLISGPVSLQPGDRIDLADEVTLLYDVSRSPHRVALTLSTLTLSVQRPPAFPG